MAPSAVESVPQTVEDIKQKVLPVNEKQTPPASEIKPVQTSNELEESLPDRLENHKEPLKLAGALAHLEHFDVTPVIGREYVNVDLVELLRAPNSDELLRDLAITSLLTFNPAKLC
jgi:hypothetical protein